MSFKSLSRQTLPKSEECIAILLLFSAVEHFVGHGASKMSSRKLNEEAILFFNMQLLADSILRSALEMPG